VNNPLVQPDPGLFIWTILTFLVLVALLAKFAWKPLMQALEARQKTIAQALDDARQAREELDRARDDAARLLNEARRESDGIVTRARADGDRLREELHQQAVREAEHVTRNAQRQIEQETARAIARIREEAVDLSVDIASKILGRTISKTDNEHLIDEAVRQVSTVRM
jgi:F-type H+-transporting ATPase subunit b